VVAVLAALVLAGCDQRGDAGPQALPAAAVRAIAPDRSPSPAAVIGPGAGAGPARGLVASTSTVRRYFAVVNNLHRDMDPRALAALFTGGCRCRAQVRAVRSAARLGEHYIDHATVLALRPSHEGPGYLGVLADYRTASGGLVDGDGRRLTTTRARRVRWEFTLRRTGSRWLISDIEDIS
jgi:hypothetical protein